MLKLCSRGQEEEENWHELLTVMGWFKNKTGSRQLWKWHCYCSLSRTTVPLLQGKTNLRFHGIIVALSSVHWEATPHTRHETCVCSGPFLCPRCARWAWSLGHLLERSGQSASYLQPACTCGSHWSGENLALTLEGFNKKSLEVNYVINLGFVHSNHI